MRIPFQGAALALACAAPLPAFAQTAGFGLDPYVTLPGLKAGYYAAGDVNGDHRDDLVALGSATPGMSGVRIYAQQANGTLGAEQDVAYAAPLQGYLKSLLLVDLDGDSADEIVVGYSRDLQGEPGDGIAILHRNGAGGYAMQSFAQTERNIQMAATDVNRDGKPDIVTLSQREGLRVYYGNGAGGVSFSGSLPAATISSDTRELRVGDVNGDGYDDIVVNYLQSFPPYAPEFAVYAHNGTSGFLSPVLYQAADNTSTEDGFTVADLTGDGRGDVVVRGSGSNLWLFAQNAVGGLANPPAPVPFSLCNGTMASPDLDRDGYPDLVKMCGTASYGRFSYFFGSPAGLTPEQIYTPLAPANNYRPGNVVFGDFNGDGCTDAVVSDYWSNVVGQSLQSVDLVKGHGCAPNADLAATIDVNEASGEVTAGVEHHGGITLDSAYAVVSLRLPSTIRVVAPPECEQIPGRLPPVGKKPQPVSRLYQCTLENLTLGERRELVFSTGGDLLSAGNDVGADAYDPKPADNSASIVF